jgi:hypothetical protein
MSMLRMCRQGKQFPVVDDRPVQGGLPLSSLPFLVVEASNE